jgi:anti-sigma-K factor RskA
VSACEKFREQIEPFALGSLDAGECAEIRAHLASGCDGCTRAMDEARWLVSQLACLAPDAQPSAMLKSRLLQAVRADAAQAKSVTSRPVSFWMWAGVAALVVLSVYSAWDARRLQKQVAALNAQTTDELQKRRQLVNQLVLAEREAIILTDPASVQIAMPCPEKDMPELRAYWHSKLGIVVTGAKVPPPAGNWTLQLWLVPKQAGAKPLSAGMIRPDASGKYVLMVANPPDTMAGTKLLAITEEPDGGSPQPTTTPKWVGGVS